MPKKKKKYKNNYPNGGDDMFFYHKKTKHPAKQISHTIKTWSNRRYTHNPNRPNDYDIDKELSDDSIVVYKTKNIFVDSIYTRGRPYKIKKKKR